MRRRSITLFLLFGVIVYPATTEHVYYHETLATPLGMNQSDVAAFVLINPEQIQRAEATVRRFLAKLTGPVDQPITLRLSSSADGDNFHETISKICKIIRAGVGEFARSGGLVKSVHPYEQIPWDSTTSADWFTESLVQGSLLLRDLIKAGEEVWFTVDRYLDAYNVSLHVEKNKLSTRGPTKSFTFLSAINDASRFNEELSECLRSTKRRTKRPSSFDLDQALADLAGRTPESVVESFKSRLNRALSHSASSNGTSNKQLYTLLCRSLVERVAGRYGDCIRDVRRLVTCVASSKQESATVIGHHTLPVEPWLTAIKDLSDCRIYADADGGANIRCNLERGLPRSASRQVKFIYEKILGRQTPGRSPLRHAANELGGVLMGSTWGRQLAYDVCQYFAIYQEGRKKLRKLAKIAARDQAAAARHKKISRSLNLYRDGILRKTVVAIGNFHRSVLEIQKFFIHGIGSAIRESWRDYIEIFACLSEWMTKLLELFGCTKLDDTDIDLPIATIIPPISADSAEAITSDTCYGKNNDIRHVVIYRKKDQMKKETDEAFGRLLQSMDHVSSMRNRNSRSTIACLANNLLLITMFMETVGFISTLFCLGEQKNEPSFEEVKQDWLSSERNRRGVVFNRFYRN